MKKIGRSPSRMILTLVGIVLSVILLFSCIVFSKTYKKEKLKNVDMYKILSAVEIKGDFNYELYRLISNKSKRVSLDVYAGSVSCLGKIGNEEINEKIYAKTVYTDNLMVDFMCNDIYENSRYRSKLLYGRLFTEDEINNGSDVVVISDCLAKLLFNRVDAIGEIISIPLYELNESSGVREISNYKRLTVIGVVKDLKNLSEYYKDINKSNDNSFLFTIFCPLFSIQKETDELTMRITSFDTSNNYKEYTEEIDRLIMEFDNDYEVNNYYTALKSISNELDTVNKLIIFISVFMFLISGICITNTMFFSVKERVNEIGIRKSIGAYNGDIIAQFIIEGAIYGVLASLIGIILGWLMDLLIYILLNKLELWKTSIMLDISLDSIFFVVIITIMTSILSSIIPALYASNIKIADAIKYD